MGILSTMKFRIFSITSPMFETWDINQQESKLSVYQSTALWTLFWLKQKKQLDKENYIMKSYVLCILYKILLWQINEGG